MSFNQQILYAYSHNLLNITFIQSLLKKGFDINSKIFDGNGIWNKDILYFFLISDSTSYISQENFLDSVIFLLDSGFKFNHKHNYLFLFLIALHENNSYNKKYVEMSKHQSSILYIKLLKCITKMIDADIKINNCVSIYFDPDDNDGKILLVNNIYKENEDSYQKEFYKITFDSILLNMKIGILKFDNTFDKRDLYFNQNIILTINKCDNNLLRRVKCICEIKNKLLINHLDYQDKYEIIDLD